MRNGRRLLANCRRLSGKNGFANLLDCETDPQGFIPGESMWNLVLWH